MMTNVNLLKFYAIIIIEMSKLSDNFAKILII